MNDNGNGKPMMLAPIQEKHDPSPEEVAEQVRLFNEAAARAEQIDRGEVFTLDHEAQRKIVAHIVSDAVMTDWVQGKVEPECFAAEAHVLLVRTVLKMYGETGVLPSQDIVMMDLKRQVAKRPPEVRLRILSEVMGVYEHCYFLEEREYTRRWIDEFSRQARLNRALYQAMKGRDIGALRQALDDIEADTEEDGSPSFAKLTSSAELLAMDLRPEFLVRGVLVKGAPCIIGGRSKVLKTSIAVDLALSLGSGTPFLGRFDVPRPVRVAFWTGESGAPTIRETALRIADSKGIGLKDVSVSWSFDLPKLCRADHLAALETVIREQQLEVVIIDPLYLSLMSAETAGNAGNLYAMGAALEPLSRLAQATGCTVVLLHHFKKSGIPDPDNPAALEELSQSGAAEWARQWILLQRRTPYMSDGVHDLWLRAGGSAGHSSLVAVTVEEGLIDPDTGSGRHWRIVVSNRAAAIADDKMKAAAEKQEQRDRTEAERILKVVTALESHPAGETTSGLRSATGIDSPKLKPILDKLVKNGQVIACTVGKNGAKYEGFKLAGGTVV